MKVTHMVLDLLPVSFLRGENCSMRKRGLTESPFFNLQDLLQPRGVFYLVAVSENDPQQICQTMRGRGFEAEVCSAMGGGAV